MSETLQCFLAGLAVGFFLGMYAMIRLIIARIHVARIHVARIHVEMIRKKNGYQKDDSRFIP
jgi:hypothetical protein